MNTRFNILRISAGALLVLGLTLPVSAEQIPQPFMSYEENAGDWWEGFDHDNYDSNVKVKEADGTPKSSTTNTVQQKDSEKVYHGHDTAYDAIDQWEPADWESI